MTTRLTYKAKYPKWYYSLFMRLVLKESEIARKNGDTSIQDKLKYSVYKTLYKTIKALE